MTRHAALIANVAASAAIAQPAPAPATSTPAARGPRISPVETALERNAFAGCSCSAVTTSGSRPVDAGLKNPVAVPVTPASSASIHTSATPRYQQSGHRALARHPDQVRDHHHRAARGPVGHHAAHEHASDEGEHPCGQHESDFGGRAADLQHREGERHGDHAIAQDGHRLPAEEQAELAPVEHLETFAQARHEEQEVRRATDASPWPQAEHGGQHREDERAAGGLPPARGEPKQAAPPVPGRCMSPVSARQPAGVSRGPMAALPLTRASAATQSTRSSKTFHSPARMPSGDRRSAERRAET